MSNHVNSTEEFLQERKTEKEIYAINNYFQLLKQAELSEYDSNTLMLIGGDDTFRKLIVDIKEENIDIFSNTRAKLLLKLGENLRIVTSTTYSRSTLLNSAIEIARIVLERYQYLIDDDNFDLAYATKTAYEKLILSLPKTEEDKKVELESLKPQQKTLGERK